MHTCASVPLWQAMQMDCRHTARTAILREMPAPLIVIYDGWKHHRKDTAYQSIKITLNKNVLKVLQILSFCANIEVSKKTLD